MSIKPWKSDPPPRFLLAIGSAWRRSADLSRVLLTYLPLYFRTATDFFQNIWPQRWPFQPNGTGKTTVAQDTLPPVLTSGRLTRSQIVKLAQCLRAQKALLLSFTDQLEAEFLKLGAALQTMDGEANFIEQKYDRIYAVISGQGGDSPLQHSFALLQQAEELVFSGYRQYEQVLQVISELCTKMDTSIHRQNQLQRDLSLLPPVVVQFRVQASEFDEEVRQSYYALADEMNAMLDQIRAAVEHQFISLWRSRSICRGLAEDLTSNIAIYRVEIQNTLEISRNHLQSLNGAMSDSSLTVKDLSRHSQGVSQEINRVIMAIQCQDITRQKVQHVAQAIDEMEENLNQAIARRFDFSRARALRQFVGEAATIQCRQAKAVFEDNQKAAAQIEAGMRGLQGAVKNLAEGAVRAGQLALSSGIIQQSIESMRDMMVMIRLTARKSEEIRTAIGPLQTTFEATTAKISALAQGVRRGALNAQIQAARVKGGDVLEVLAEQTRIVSDQTLRTVQQLGASMNEMSEAIIKLQNDLQQHKEMAGAKHLLLAEESIPCEASLQAMRRELPELIDPINSRQQTLAALVAQGIGENRFPATVAATQAASLPFWEALSAWALAPDATENASANVVRQLDRLKENYTMANEREIHEDTLKILPKMDHGSEPSPETLPATPVPAIMESQQVPLNSAGADPIPALPAASTNESPLPSDKPEEKKAEDLGDNIELF